MKKDIETEVEKIEQDPEVRRELNRTSGRGREVVTRVKTRLIKELLAELKKDPQRVKFPRDDIR